MKNQVDQQTKQQNDEKMQKQIVINERKFFGETTNVARKEIKSKHRVQQQRQQEQMKEVNIHQHQTQGVFIPKKQQQQQCDNVKKIPHLKKVNIHQRPKDMLNKVQKCTKSSFNGNPKKQKNLDPFKLPGSDYIKPGLLTNTKDQLANKNDAFKTSNVKHKPSCELFAPQPKRVLLKSCLLYTSPSPRDRG